MRGSRRYDPAFNRIKILFYEHLIDPLTFKFSDCVISISEGLSSELRSNVGSITKKKIKTIGLFFDAEQLIASSSEAIEDEILALKGSPIVVSAGRLSQEKGFQHLIKVFSDVHLTMTDAKLILIGDGPLYQSLVEMCQTLNLSVSDGKSSLRESAVIFLGYRSNPCRYFRVAKLFVSSSLTEGFSNVIVEALAAGVPVLATDCPWGPRTILWKNPTDVSTPYPTEFPTYANYGVLMPRIDQVKFQQVWVDELMKLLSQPFVIDEYVEKGFERVNEYDFKQVLNKWLDVIDEPKVCNGERY
jgi:glycosyltransferase involved in cell wall biosynthesis